MGRKGETTSYTLQSFDEYYTRKLDDLKVKLKAIIYGGLPFVVSQEYACKKCAGRLKLHADGRITCLVCEPLPANWSKKQQEYVTEILRSYPDIDACAEEWSPPKKEKPQRFFTTETVAFGARVEEARIALGWSQDNLASKILKKDMANISRSTVNMVEHGHQNCSQHIRGQLDHIFSCDVCKAGARCEQLQSIQGLREKVCLEA